MFVLISPYYGMKCVLFHSLCLYNTTFNHFLLLPSAFLLDVGQGAEK